MSTPLLTIVVPTYNRAARLELLLTTLRRELVGIEDMVSVMVADNASPDHTPAVVAAFVASYRNATAFRHPTNVGPDENFCSCVEKTDTRFFWLIGDDDLPKAGVLPLMLDLLTRESPDLVFMNSDPRDEIVDSEPHRPVTSLSPVKMSRAGFARRVHVYSTFISGIIVNRETYAGTDEAQHLRRFMGTHLVQLGWVMAVLQSGRRFIFVERRCVLGLQKNSGGYSLMTVFGKNFPLVVAQALGTHSRMTRAIVKRCVIVYLPSMVWQLRQGNVGKFQFENVTEVMRPVLRSYASYWLFVEPIYRLPDQWAQLVISVAAWTASALAHFDKRIESFRGKRLDRR